MIEKHGTGMSVCKSCGEEQPLAKFAMQRGYRIWRCNSCRALYAQKLEECRRNRRISELLRWPRSA